MLNAARQAHGEHRLSPIGTYNYIASMCQGNFAHNVQSQSEAAVRSTIALLIWASSKRIKNLAQS